MVTYPSTHGVFETAITEICALVHDAGGQVYVDGANLNALVGLAKPGTVRRRRLAPEPAQDLLHPARRWRPGRRPGCRPRAPGAVPALAPPASGGRAAGSRARRRGSGTRQRCAVGQRRHPADPVGVHPHDGRRRACCWRRRRPSSTPTTWPRASTTHYPVLYTGARGLVAHECILDVRGITAATGVTVDDIAKRLIDYGFHAPTMSFPVSGTLMVEPTESENLYELDRFCDAMIAIRARDRRGRRRHVAADDNPLHNAPHTADCLIGEWAHPYPARLAAFPVDGPAAGQVLAAGPPHRRCVRRPQPRVLVPSAGGAGHPVIAVFDIDGVLADATHRQHHVAGRPKDWDAFFARRGRRPGPGGGARQRLPGTRRDARDRPAVGPSGALSRRHGRLAGPARHSGRRDSCCGRTRTIGRQRRSRPS